MFFEKYGPFTIFLARFVPIVRTYAPLVAGAADMRYRTFLMWNVTGGIVWGAGLTLLGYLLGQISFIREPSTSSSSSSSWCRSSRSCSSGDTPVPQQQERRPDPEPTP